MANDHLLEKQMLSSRDSCGHPLEAIVLPRVLWCCVQRHALRLSVHSVQLAVSDRETGKRTHFLCQLGTTLFLVLSSDLSQTYESLEISRLACGTHFGSEPNGRLEEPWRSAPCKVWKARFDQMDHFRVTRHVFTSPRCFCPHLKSLQIS